MVKINFYEKCKVSTRFLDGFIISGLLLLTILVTVFALMSNKDSAVGESTDIPVQNEVTSDEDSPCNIENKEVYKNVRTEL